MFGHFKVFPASELHTPQCPGYPRKKKDFRIVRLGGGNWGNTCCKMLQTIFVVEQYVVSLRGILFTNDSLYIQIMNDPELERIWTVVLKWVASPSRSTLARTVTWRRFTTVIWDAMWAGAIHLTSSGPKFREDMRRPFIRFDDYLKQTPNLQFSLQEGIKCDQMLLTLDSTTVNLLKPLHSDNRQILLSSCPGPWTFQSWSFLRGARCNKNCLPYGSYWMEGPKTHTLNSSLEWTEKPGITSIFHSPCVPSICPAREMEPIRSAQREHIAPSTFP